MKKIVDNVDNTLHQVELSGVKFTEYARRRPFDINLCLEMGSGDYPTISIMLIVNEDDDSEQIELEDCLPLDRIALPAASSKMIQEVMRRHSLEFVCDFVYASLAAPSTKLKVEATPEGIRFNLHIGSFRTEATVNPERVKRFIVPT